MNAAPANHHCAFVCTSHIRRQLISVASPDASFHVDASEPRSGRTGGSRGNVEGWCATMRFLYSGSVPVYRGLSWCGNREHLGVARTVGASSNRIGEGLEREWHLIGEGRDLRLAGGANGGDGCLARGAGHGLGTRGGARRTCAQRREHGSGGHAEGRRHVELLGKCDAYRAYSTRTYPPLPTSRAGAYSSCIDDDAPLPRRRAFVVHPHRRCLLRSCAALGGRTGATHATCNWLSLSGAVVVQMGAATMLRLAPSRGSNPPRGLQSRQVGGTPRGARMQAAPRVGTLPARLRRAGGTRRGGGLRAVVAVDAADTEQQLDLDAFGPEPTHQRWLPQRATLTLTR